jgi:hypothetical protein
MPRNWKEIDEENFYDKNAKSLDDGNFVNLFATSSDKLGTAFGMR